MEVASLTLERAQRAMLGKMALREWRLIMSVTLAGDIVALTSLKYLI